MNAVAAEEITSQEAKMVKLTGKNPLSLKIQKGEPNKGLVKRIENGQQLSTTKPMTHNDQLVKNGQQQ